MASWKNQLPVVCGKKWPLPIDDRRMKIETTKQHLKKESQAVHCLNELPRGILAYPNRRLFGC